MNYQKIYNQLIEKRQKEILTDNIYSEKHHIIPKCLKGPNNKSNLVRLTAREHYIAHVLLAKIHNIRDLYAAVVFMKSDRNPNRQCKRNSIVYEFNRKNYSDKQSKKVMGKNNPMFGKHRSDKVKLALSKANKGKIIPEDVRKKLSIKNKNQVPWNKGRTLTQQHKDNLSKSIKGKPLTDEHKRKISNSIKIWHQKRINETSNI